MNNITKEYVYHNADGTILGKKVYVYRVNDVGSGLRTYP